MRGGPAPPALGEPVPPRVETVEGPPPGPPPPGPPVPEREIWPWLVAVLVVALVGVGLGIWLSQRGGGKKHAATTSPASTALSTAPTQTTRPAATVKVPKVVGLTSSAAVQQLRSFGFKTALQQQASSRPPGTVVGQNPATGAAVARGATIILAISRKSTGTNATTSAQATTEATTQAKPAAPAKVAVPNVLGIAANDAAKHLRAAGLEPALQTVSSTKPAGVVVAQSPGPGHQLAKGARVTLHLSKGPQAATTATTSGATTTGSTTSATTTSGTTTTAPQTATVPNLVGSSRADAQAALRRAGLVTEVKGVPSAKPEGTVVSQAPQAGASLKRGEHVLINVANGQKPGEGTGPPTTVPDVVGQQRAEAQQALRQAGFVTEVKGYPSTKPDGTVLAQDPKGGSTAKKGAHVLINVANGQQP